MRACPIHLGHQAVLKKMIADVGQEQSLLFLGSSNRVLSFKYMFSFKERHDLAKRLFPELQILGLPDFGNDEEWLFNLDTQLKALGSSLESVTFYGGCHEDIVWFTERGLQTNITNRFSGEESPVISATQVRDALLEKRSLEGLVDPLLHEPVRELFEVAMGRLKGM